jgi:hypothetical protein
MPSFALVTEGITDQVVLEYILDGYYEEEVDVQIIQPARDATDEARQDADGGFERVLEYCSLREFEDIFAYNDFVIIQIDTDIGSHVNVGVALTDAGGERAAPDLVSDFTALILSKISAPVKQLYAGRIILAIAVHSTECWLLPLYADRPATMKKRIGCEEALNRALRKRNIKYAKEYRCYCEIAKSLLKRKYLDHCAKMQESLEIFLKSLPP